MIAGFDLASPLVCEGIIGDGCGGGRLFSVETEALRVYDPQSKEIIVLLEDIKNPKSISKAACILKIECQDSEIKFDLSALKKV